MVLQVGYVNFSRLGQKEDMLVTLCGYNIYEFSNFVVEDNIIWDTFNDEW